MNIINPENARKPAVAGTFYPADATALATYVTQTLAACPRFPSPPLAVISPHAGYRYSGALTARALASTGAGQPTSVVVLSPSHHHNFEGIALTSAGDFHFPQGAMAVDIEAGTALIDAGLAHVEDAAHDREHGIEVQLPFLKQLHPKASLVPLVIGRASDKEVAAAVDFLANFRDNPPLFVLSSDLSHFLTHPDAQAKDASTAKLIETGQAGALTPQHACGSRAISGFFQSAFGQGRRLMRLGMASSYDATGDDARTVGYGAWSIHDGRAEILPQKHCQELLRVARQALEIYLHKGTDPRIDLASFAPELKTHAAAFVTLTQGGRLRGCIGSLMAHAPLVQDVAANAIKAGFNDPRFRPLGSDELPRTDIKIAVLSPARVMSFTNEADLLKQLVPGRDGLILRDGGHRGIFLPMVWDQLTTPEAFFNGLKVKAGLPNTHWSDSLRVERFVTEAFADQDAQAVKTAG